MRCPRCSGSGTVPFFVDDITRSIGSCPVCYGSGEIDEPKQTNGDNVRTMTDRDLEILFDKIEMYARRCESDNWYKCDFCECPWCDRNGEWNFEKWLKEKCNVQEKNTV